MVQKIDLRGKECPIPVIQTKKALEATKDHSIITIVDSDVSKENIEKLAKSLKYKSTVKEAQGEFYIEIFKQSGIDLSEELSYPSKNSSPEDLTVMITRDTLGDGKRELGEVLMKGYIYTLTEAPKTPKNLLFLNSGVHLTVEGSPVIDHLRRLEENLLFLNSGVHLTVEGSPVIDHLRRLEEKGVTILSCGTCLDYYKVKNKLVVGGIGNMYDMVEKSSGSKKTVTL